jgi:hypothetical protein
MVVLKVLGFMVVGVLTLPALAVGALYIASKSAAANAARSAALISSDVARGETRADVYRFLRANGLTPYDQRFVLGKTIPGSDPAHPRSGIGCDLSDRASGAWPYRNEPLPRQPAGCDPEVAPAPVPEPEADIELGGGFDLTCGWSTEADITFDRGDRVKDVKIFGPQKTCL